LNGMMTTKKEDMKPEYDFSNIKGAVSVGWVE
jgi:hypothetical protein